MSSLIINRRGLIGGLAAMFAAPAIVHAQNIMPVRAMEPLLDYGWYEDVYHWATYATKNKMIEAGWVQVSEDLISRRAIGSAENLNLLMRKSVRRMPYFGMAGA